MLSSATRRVYRDLAAREPDASLWEVTASPPGRHGVSQSCQQVVYPVLWVRHQISLRAALWLASARLSILGSYPYWKIRPLEGCFPESQQVKP